RRLRALAGGDGREERPGPRRERLGCEARERAPHPREEVLDGREDGDGDERERGEERDRVAVYRPDEAVEPVPTEPGAPVEVRLEQRERGRARREQDRVADGEAGRA